MGVWGCLRVHTVKNQTGRRWSTGAEVNEIHTTERPRRLGTGGTWGGDAASHQERRRIVADVGSGLQRLSLPAGRDQRRDHAGFREGMSHRRWRFPPGMDRVALNVG